MRHSPLPSHTQVVRASEILRRIVHELGDGPELTNLPDFRVATAAARSALNAYGAEELEFHHVSTFDDLMPRLEIAETLVALHDAGGATGKERLPRQ